MRRHSLTNMLGEFVGFQRTPGLRLSSMSNQEINEAVKDEKRSFKVNEAEKPVNRKPRQRYLSEGDIRSSSPVVTVNELKRGLDKSSVMHVSSNPGGENGVDVVMRVKPSSKSPKRKDRPTSLIERIRRKISYTKTGAIIESDEEKDQDVSTDESNSSFPRRRDSTRSEKLFIPITPVETVQIRIVQVIPGTCSPSSPSSAVFMRISVITVSDSCSNGTRIDESGPTLISLAAKKNDVTITNHGVPIIVQDDVDEIQKVLEQQLDDADVIITTGGTGFAKRDVTPEATLKVIERRCSGLEVALHTRSLQSTPFAALSRAIAGIKGNTLIVNMPGSVKAVKECWEVLDPILKHAVNLLTDSDDGAQHAKMK